MTIGFLISKESTQQYTNIDLLESAGKSLGHKTVRLYEADFTCGDDKLLYQNTALENIDIILPRPNFVEEPSLHTYVVQFLNDSGFKLVNALHDLNWTKNKIEQHRKIIEFNLPHPRFVITRSPQQALKSAQRFHFPVIIKIAFGTLGKGVFFAPSAASFITIADYLSIRDGNPLIVQEFIKEANGTDIRAFVIGNKVVASMRRTAPEDDVRANTTSGGTGSNITLTEQEKALAIKATMDFKLDIAGVDIIQSSRGPLILEINANPGFKELQEVTGVDIAGEIIKFSIKQASKKR